MELWNIPLRSLIKTFYIDELKREIMGDNKEKENKEIIISKDGKEKEVREEK